MRQTSLLRCARNIALVFALLAQCVMQLPAKDGELTAREVVQKNLESIGTADARAAISSRVLNATARVTFILGNTGGFNGKGSMLSEGNKIRIGLKFLVSDYPGEQIAYDGSEADFGFVRAGQRSPLSQLLFTQDSIIKEGLLGGELSTAWPLLNLSEKQPELVYGGLKKFEGKRLHEVKYLPHRRGDWQISLYFDPETFRHVASQYRFRTAPPLRGQIVTNAELRDTSHVLTERFDQFEVVDGLTLPHHYRLNYTYDGARSSSITEWSMTITQLTHNPRIDPEYFTVH
jgi:hypothetical protein